MSKISVIVPIFNAGKVLPRCINSIIAQTYKDWELLLIDDGSQDGSKKICEEYVARDSRIILLSKENGGVSSARNMGIKNATGKYVCFIDADDEIMPDMLEVFFNEIKKADVDMVICGLLQYISNNCIERVPKAEILNGFIEIAEFVQEHYLEWLISAPWGKLFKRDILPFNGFDQSISLGEDLKFNIQYFQNIKNISVLEKALYIYHDDVDGSLTKTYKLGNYEAIIDIYQNTKKYISSTLEEKKRNMKKINYKLFSFCISFMHQNIGIATREKEKEFIKIMISNEELQSAIRNLPRMDFIREWYVFAIKHKCINLLYLFSLIKYKWL